VSGHDAAPAEAPPRALILVRNAVTHDNRVLREAETLRRAGFAVLVLGAASVQTPAGADRVGGVSVVRIRARGGRIGRTLVFNLRAAVACWRTRPDLVHANDYNTMWIALAAKLLCGSRVVYDSHELWADRNGRPEWRPWLIAGEMLFVRAADTVITASPGYADALAGRYRVPRPAVIRNIPVAPSAPAPPAEEACAIYVGGLMPGRGLECGIEALARVPGLHMTLVGPGAAGYRARLLALAKRAGVADRLRLLPAVAPDQVLNAIRGASFGLMLIEPVCRSYELTLPNKLFEYAAAGVPMLAADLPVIGAVVREHGLGEAVATDDVARVAEAVRRLLDPARNRELRRRVAAFAAANPWEAERDRLSAVYRETMGPG
jgi:glycosyltransferase involved in cell wall biosynthesis